MIVVIFVAAHYIIFKSYKAILKLFVQDVEYAFAGQLFKILKFPLILPNCRAETGL